MNADFYGSRKEFWAFVGRTKLKKLTLKKEAGVSVTSSKGKLEAF